MIAAADYKQMYEQTQVALDAAHLKIAAFEQELSQLKKMIFGSRHERHAPATDSAQLNLDIETETAAAIVTTKKIEYTLTTVSKPPLQHPGRMKLPEHLRREEVILEPLEDTTGCKKIGEEITEQLDYVPGELFVRKYIRSKYALPGAEGVTIASLPEMPVNKGMAGPGLLAQVVIDKYVDHLPLYRQMQRFERSGVKLSYSTLTDWVSGTAKLLTPLYEAHKKQVLSTHYLHADETPIKVLDRDKKGKTHRGYFWVYHNSVERLALFEYRMGRGREGPQEVLKDFTGYLQTDGYAVYDDFDKQTGITLLHCMAHARRGFTESLNNDQMRAAYALDHIQQLYAIERKAKLEQLSADQRKQLRSEQSVPILLHLKGWLKDNYVQVLPQSVIGKAIAYSLERWDKLMIYATDGQLNIDNNPVENSIRPVAIGRKNYLFCGSHEAAQRSAMLYSLVSSCKLHGINPATWLTDVIGRIPNHSIKNICELLPQNWNKTEL